MTQTSYPKTYKVSELSKPVIITGARLLTSKKGNLFIVADITSTVDTKLTASVYLPATGTFRDTLSLAVDLAKQRGLMGVGPVRLSEFLPQGKQYPATTIKQDGHHVEAYSWNDARRELGILNAETMCYRPLDTTRMSVKDNGYGKEVVIVYLAGGGEVELPANKPIKRFFDESYVPESTLEIQFEEFTPEGQKDPVRFPILVNYVEPDELSEPSDPFADYLDL